MAISANAKQYHEKMFPSYVSRFLEADPEFIERFDNFAFDEVVNSDDLEDRTRMMESRVLIYQAIFLCLPRCIKMALFIVFPVKHLFYHLHSEVITSK